MTFANPSGFAWLIVVPLLGAAFYLAIASRRRAQAAFADKPMWNRLVAPGAGRNGWSGWSGFLTLLGVVLVSLAAARPQWGTIEETLSQQGADILIVLDVSRSMLAEDVAPNRLERAKSDIKDLLEHLDMTGDRVGLICYAGNPVMSVPLTTDRNHFRLVLDEVSPRTAVVGGSRVGDALQRALQALEDIPGRDRMILLISDGGDEESDPVSVAKLAAERGIRIFAIGLGDPIEGARIPDGESKTGSRYLTYRGDEVVSKLEEEVLEKIAVASGGQYIPARTSHFDLGRLYENHLAELSRTTLRSDVQKRQKDQFQWFLGAGILCLMVEWLGTRIAANSMGAASTFRPAMAALLLAGVLLPSGTVHAESTDPGTSTHSAQFAPGGIDPTSKLPERSSQPPTEEAEAVAGEPPTVPSRSATAWLREGQTALENGDLEAASVALARASESESREVRFRSLYGLGLARLRQAAQACELNPAAEDQPTPATSMSEAEADGPTAAPMVDRDQVRRLAREAADTLRQATILDPSSPDARHNLELARRWILDQEERWRAEDRDAKLANHSAAELMADLEGKLWTARDEAKTWFEQPDSADRRLAIRRSARQLRGLEQDLVDVREKGQQETGPQNSTPGDSSRTADAWASALAPVERSLLESVIQLRQLERTSLESLRRAGSAARQAVIASLAFDSLLDRAIADQDRWLANAQRMIEDEDHSVESALLTDGQQSISTMARRLAALAEEGLRQGDADGQPGLPSQADAEEAPSAMDPNQAATWERAIELAPQAALHAAEAAELIAAERVAVALEHQREALELLKKIRENPSQSPDDQNSDSQDSDSQDSDSQDSQDSDSQDSDSQKSDSQTSDSQDSKDNDSQDSDSQDQGNQDQKDQKQKDQDAQDQDQKDSKQGDQDKDSASESKPSESKEDQQGEEQKADQAKEKGAEEKPEGKDKEEPRTGDKKEEQLNAEQAKETLQQAGLDEFEAAKLLRRVRQRQKDYLERRYQMDRARHGVVPVEKDW